jgi:hypothetical protein
MPEKEKPYKILAYGIEKVGLSAPKTEISNRSYKLIFESFKTERRFNEFDGIILFQGIFESYKFGTDLLDQRTLDHSHDARELDKRIKELGLLIKNGGFVCFILHKPFIDRFYGAGYNEDLRSTDLCKFCLIHENLYREDIGRSVPFVTSLRDEFGRFLELYGSANTTFRNLNDSLEWRVVAKVGHDDVGMILFDKLFFIPSSLPENSQKRVTEYFSMLSEALTLSFNKLRMDVPGWIASIAFNNENELRDQRQAWAERIEQIDQALAKYAQFKRVLIGSGEPLVEDVARLLKNGFSFDLNADDSFKEDLKILDETGNPAVLIEVKGTSRGVKREYINQTDSHRERSGFDSSFPALLAINTHTANSNSIESKDQPVPEEQIKHAVKMKVLIVRTLDLIFLLEQKERGAITVEDVLTIFREKTGWLRASMNSHEVIQ